MNASSAKDERLAEGERRE